MRDLPAPPSLTELQTWFARHITSPIEKSDEAHIPQFSPRAIREIRKRIAPSPHLKSEERLGIYQQQYWWRLITIMQEIFPALVRLFDYEDFNRFIAVPYLLKHPPNDWFLSSIGNLLPQWIKRSYKEKDALLVLGLAQIDIAYEKLLFSEHFPPFKETPSENAILHLQPHVLLFEFDVDFFSFRRELMTHPIAHWADSHFPKLENNGKKRRFVLFRKEEQSLFEEISEELFLLLNRFKKGAKLIDLLPFLETCEGLLEAFQLIGLRGWLSLGTV